MVTSYLDLLMGAEVERYSPMEGLERQGIKRRRTYLQDQFEQEAVRTLPSGQGSSLDFLGLVMQQQYNATVLGSKTMGGLRRLDASEDKTLYSPTQLKAMYPETSFNFKSAMSKTLAERQIEHYENQERIASTLRNFKSNDPIANLASSIGLLDAYQAGLGLAGTIVANVPDAIAETAITAGAGAALGSVAGPLGTAGGALIGTGVGTAAKVGRAVIKASQVATKTANVLNVSSDIYRTGGATRQFFMQSGVHAGLIENSVGSVLTAMNELHQGASYQQAVKEAGMQFLTGAVANPVIDLAFKGVGKAWSLPQQYKIDKAIKELDVKRTALNEMPDSVFKQESLARLDADYAKLTTKQAQAPKVTQAGIPATIQDTTAAVQQATHMVHSLNGSSATLSMSKIIQENPDRFGQGTKEAGDAFVALGQNVLDELDKLTANPRTIEALDAVMQTLDGGKAPIVTSNVLWDATLGEVMDGKRTQGVFDYTAIKQATATSDNLDYMIQRIEQENDVAVRQAMIEGALKHEALTPEKEQLLLKYDEELYDELVSFHVDESEFEDVGKLLKEDVIPHQTFTTEQFVKSTPKSTEWVAQVLKQTEQQTIPEQMSMPLMVATALPVLTKKTEVMVGEVFRVSRQQATKVYGLLQQYQDIPVLTKDVALYQLARLQGGLSDLSADVIRYSTKQANAIQKVILEYSELMTALYRDAVSYSTRQLLDYLSNVVYPTKDKLGKSLTAAYSNLGDTTNRLLTKVQRFLGKTRSEIHNQLERLDTFLQEEISEALPDKAMIAETASLTPDVLDNIQREIDKAYPSVSTKVGSGEIDAFNQLSQQAQKEQIKAFVEGDVKTAWTLVEELMAVRYLTEAIEQGNTADVVNFSSRYTDMRFPFTQKENVEAVFNAFKNQEQHKIIPMLNSLYSSFFRGAFPIRTLETTTKATGLPAKKSKPVQLSEFVSDNYGAITKNKEDLTTWFKYVLPYETRDAEVRLSVAIVDSLIEEAAQRLGMEKTEVYERLRFSTTGSLTSAGVQANNAYLLIKLSINYAGLLPTTLIHETVHALESLGAFSVDDVKKAERFTSAKNLEQRVSLTSEVLAHVFEWAIQEGKIEVGNLDGLSRILLWRDSFTMRETKGQDLYKKERSSQYGSKRTDMLAAFNNDSLLNIVQQFTRHVKLTQSELADLRDARDIILKEAEQTLSPEMLEAYTAFLNPKHIEDVTNYYNCRKSN
jgi:hypothetical protein